MKTCEHPIDSETLCGKPATAVIKTREGKLSLKEMGGYLGRGVGSLWQPVCDLHKSCYPDYEGFEIT